MKPRNFLVILSPIIILLLVCTPFVAALPRNTYLTNFIDQNALDNNNGFSNAPGGDTISYPATYYSLSILNYYGKTQSAINSANLKDHLEDVLNNIVDNANLKMYDLFYVLKSLNALQFTFSTSLKNKITAYLNATEQSGGGFSYTKESTTPNLIATYMAMESYQMVGSIIPNKTIQKSWILSCYNLDGGYGGSQTEDSSLPNTFYAILSFEELWNITDLSNYNTTTLTYLKGFYQQNGGYLIDHLDTVPLLSSTYYCIKALSIIDKNQITNKERTISWILEHQNTDDGGFSEVREGTNVQKSTVTSSYYAFQTLMILNAVSYLNEDIGVVPFNWVILLIIFIVIGVVIVLGYYIYKKRKI
ncbi:MAG: terpene cyclase/mutase family protein [Candidatus Lokiarchaeota archaeon]